MAFPWLFEASFEDGTTAPFDAEVDTTSRLDILNYSQMAQIPNIPAPYRGAYCCGVNLGVSATDAYLQETGSWDTSASGTIFFRFAFYVSRDITMANADEFAIFQLWSGTNTPEVSLVVNFTTANGLRLGIGELGGTNFLPLSTGMWHMVELKCVIDSGVGNDGTIDAWLDGSSFTQVTALDQGAITSGIMGVVAQDAGTTKGRLFFDAIIADDARIFPISERFPANLLMTVSGHAFVGPGWIENASLLSGGATDNVLTVYDTDTGYTSDAGNAKLELKNVVASDIVDPAGVPVYCYRGAYVVLGGTNPRAQVKISGAAGYSSDGAIRAMGYYRKQRMNNA